MACTPEEIERKRKQALEKLNAKKQKMSLSPSRINNCNVKPLTVTNSHQNNQNLNNYAHNNSPKVSSPKFNFTNNKQNICSKINQSSANSIKTSINSLSNNKLTKNSTNSISLPMNSKPGNNSAIPVNKFFGDSITGTCVLISNTRFEVNIKYHEPVIQLFKTVPSNQYSIENKTWNFHIEHHNLLMNKLSLLQPHVIVEKLPNYVINLMNAKPKDSEINLENIDSILLETLMPFQKEGVLFGIRNNGRCLIADEMGLGKTLQALAIASYYRNDWPLLIVTTSSIRNTWEEAIYKYLPSVPVSLIRYMTTGKDYINDALILILSYDFMSKYAENLKERKFGVLILDESHIIKNFKAKCTKSAISVSKIMKRVILLSGTPALSRPSELFSQLSIIDEKFFGNFFEYSKRYCNGQTTRFGWDATGKSNLTELEIILTRKFMIRRTKTDVLNTLPGKHREVIRLDVGLNKLSHQEQLNLNTLVDNYVQKKAQEKHCALLSLFSESARIKIPSVCLYITNILKTNEKFIIFAHHQVMLDAICKVLDQHKKKFIRIDGTTSSDQRKYFIDKFQLNDECIAAVLSITAANAGINLTAASIVLFAELHWNPSILAQAESRAHRIGQQNAVIVRYLLASSTVDDHIWPLLLSKQNVLNEVGLSKESFEDTAVSEQIVCSPSNLTQAGTKNIADYFEKTPPTSNTESNPNSTLEKFLSSEDDELFLNADFDF